MAEVVLEVVVVMMMMMMVVVVVAVVVVVVEVVMMEDGGGRGGDCRYRGGGDCGCDDDGSGCIGGLSDPPGGRHLQRHRHHRPLGRTGESHGWTGRQ